jgi:hypothetical protein
MKEKMNGSAALCDLDQIDAMGLYMELEAIEIQIEAAILHLSKAQELLAAPVVKDMAAVAGYRSQLHQRFDYFELRNLMPPIKIKPLNRREVPPVSAVLPASAVKDPLQAVRITVEMNDGSIFGASGANANAIWHYQMECEQLANANGTMPTYLGPGLTRVFKA